MARLERSAGVVVFRNDTALSAPVFLLLDYGRHWDFPKGHVNKGESDKDAALRELHEETGISNAVVFEDFSHEYTYFFRAQGTLIRKTVIFFLAQTASQDVTISHEHVGYAFLAYDEACQRLTFENSRKLLQRARHHLEQYS